MRLEVDEIDIDCPEIDGLFTNKVDPAFVGLRRRLPDAVRACRIIEAHGYMRRPPKGGRKVYWSLKKLRRRLDEVSIKAIRTVIFDFITAYEVDFIELGYLAEPHGDAFNIAEDSDIHPYIVIAVLRNLKEEGRLPVHPSWS
jgi:hypothetical protein